MQKILVVEDDLSIQAVLHDFLEDAGYGVTLASDGAEALKEASVRPFDLILLDIMLPRIDGYGVCRAIRQKSDVPIIMLTALDDEQNQMKGLDLQADDYITKPFSMPVLTRQNLLQMLWNYEFFGDERIIDTHIKNLRKKLKAADYIETIRGVGYRIDKENQK